MSDKENLDWVPEGVEILSEPLLTDEGHINQACLNQLEAAIKSMPPIHDRKAGDPEWTRKGYTFATEIVGGLAANIIGQSTSVPEQLIPICKYLLACLKKDERFVLHEGSEYLGGLARISLFDISSLLHEYLMDLSVFRELNEADRMEMEDGRWIDLDALLRNAVLVIRDARRHRAAFNIEFEAEYGELDE